MILLNSLIRILPWTFTVVLPAQSTAFAKSSQKTSLTPREIFRKTSGQWSGDIFLLPKRGNYMLDSGSFNPKGWQSSMVAGKVIPEHPITMHGVAWDYDLRIPIVFFDPTGKWFKPGQYQNVAVQQDIAPTLSDVLNIPIAAKKGGRNLMEARHVKDTKVKPKAIVVFVQDQAGMQFFKAHPGKAKYYESLMAKGANFVNASVAHVDVETSVGHAAVGTGTWPSEHGVAGNNFFHGGIGRQMAALGIQTGPSESSQSANPLMYFTPTLSDIWSVSQSNKPVVLSVAPAPRASIAMGGHGALFNGSEKTYVTWLDETRKDGVWTTEEQNYRLPQAFKDQPLTPWAKQIVDANGAWRGHKLFNPEGKVNDKLASATPAMIRHQSDMTLKAVDELGIGNDDVADLVWINTKSTDYCGHVFGFESDECGEVLAVADEEAQKLAEYINKKTNGEYIVVLTADHGAAPLPEVSGGYRIDRTKLKTEMNAAFDKNDNRIDVVQVITSSQVYVNQSELGANGFKMKDLVKFLKQYKAKMEAPYNVLAEEWIKKGKPKEALFFEDVVEKSDLGQ